MRFLFIVQGEGRGHMTQAITLSGILGSAGHQIVGVVIGKSKRRSIPDFVLKAFDSDILLVDSPNFETDGESKQIKLGKTIRTNLMKASRFTKSLQKIHEIVKKTQPDIILNFYDILGGLYFLAYRPKATHWVIGHQYLSLKPDYIFPKGKAINQLLYKLNTRLTAILARKKLALSFEPSPSTPTLGIVPPLIRTKVKSKEVKDGDFILGYMVNSGYAAEVMHYARKHPEINIRVYWDRKDVNEIQKALDNLTFCPIHEAHFLRDMAACQGFISTAGFESICEARYLGKPIMVIPVAGQYEQLCNALEIERLGIGTMHQEFDFGKLVDSPQVKQEDQQTFQTWVERWDQLVPELFQQAGTEREPLRSPQNWLSFYKLRKTAEI